MGNTWRQKEKSMCVSNYINIHIIYAYIQYNCWVQCIRHTGGMFILLSSNSNSSPFCSNENFQVRVKYPKNTEETNSHCTNYSPTTDVTIWIVGIFFECIWLWLVTISVVDSSFHTQSSNFHSLIWKKQHAQAWQPLVNRSIRNVYISGNCEW